MSNDSISPFLSIIVPVFNVEKYLERCLDSILCQTFKDFELICVDDGSTDDSLKILDEYSSKDRRIKIIRKKNGGMSSARNAGLDIAVGQWILFVDSDDLLGNQGVTHFDELSRLCSYTSDEVDWIVAQSTVFYEDGYKYKDVVSDINYFSLPDVGVYSNEQLKNMHMNICVWGKLYRRNVIERNKLRFPEGLRYEDEYWYPCYLLVSNAIKVIDVNLYSYFRRNGSTMGKTLAEKDFLVANERLKILRAILSYYNKFDLTGSDKDFLIDRIFILYRSALKFCPFEDRLYVYWDTGRMLRDYELDCRSHYVLKTLKRGEIETGFVKRAYKTTKSIRKRLDMIVGFVNKYR